MKETIRQMEEKLANTQTEEEREAISKDKDHLMKLLRESKDVIKKFVVIHLVKGNQRE